MTDRITDTRTHKENIDKLSVQGGPFKKPTDTTILIPNAKPL